METPNTVTTLNEVTCPFCSLLCDDLEIRAVGKQVSVTENACPRARYNIEYNEGGLQPAVDGKTVTFKTAVSRAAAILKNAQQPLLAGCATDVNGCRALLKLAETCGAIVDHEHGDAMTSNLSVLGSNGWILTTLAEVRNRADLLICIGTDTTAYPRFFERFVWPETTLTRLKPRQREVVLLGEKLDAQAATSPAGKPPLHIECSNRQINEYLSMLRSLLKKGRVSFPAAAADNRQKIEQLVEMVAASKYCVFVWDSGEFSRLEGEGSVFSITETVRELNESQRAAGLPLGGNDGGNSFTNVCSWQSGFPGRVHYQSGRPVFDPNRNRTESLLEDGSVDAVLWLSSFELKHKPPETTIPRIVISRPSATLRRNADVYIPVGTPGIDHRGNLMRVDNIVSMPVKQLVDRSRLAAAEVLTAIEENC